MTESKAWNWEAAKKESWLIPSEESYYYAEKWKNEGRKRLLDLGCGLGRHAVFFDAQGFKVTACDLSEYGIAHLRDWQKRTGRDFRAVVSDMKSLPFADNAFDCIYSYHVMSHTDTEGFGQVISEIKRVLKPGGEIYFDLCSKDSWSFKYSGFPHIDPDTVVFQGGVEDGIPHFFVDEDDIKRLFADLVITKVRHIYDISADIFRADCENDRLDPELQLKNREKGGGTHYFIEMHVQKESTAPLYGDIVGKTVSGTVDRPLGSVHPRIPDLKYPINYGYVNGITGGDGSGQDVYILGTNTPLDSFEGKVIAVWHRYNDIEDKWIVSTDGRDYTDEEIASAIDFQERYFDGELFR